MEKKIQVVRLEDAIEVARGLIRDCEYGIGAGDLVVEAVHIMEAYSFEIEEEEREDEI